MNIRMTTIVWETCLALIVAPLTVSAKLSLKKSKRTVEKNVRPGDEILLIPAPRNVER